MKAIGDGEVLRHLVFNRINPGRPERAEKRHTLCFARHPLDGRKSTSEESLHPKWFRLFRRRVVTGRVRQAQEGLEAGTRRTSFVRSDAEVQINGDTGGGSGWGLYELR